MLRQIHVENFALIDRLDLEFGQGLNILTGETGAGKSIVIDALGLALGERGSTEQIRAGAERAMVEVVFDLCDAPSATRERLVEAGLSDDGEDTLILARELTKAGKSQGRINGRLMPVSVLREISEGLIDIHGQHEHQTLLSAERHVDLLDNWLGDEVLGTRADVARHFAQANHIRRELEELRTNARERARNMDLYRFQQEEIAAAGLRAGELEDLALERSRLVNAEKLYAAANEAYEALGNVALDGINCALVATERASALDETLTPTAEQLTEAMAYAEEARRGLRTYRDQIEFNPERLEEIGDRLDLIHTLQRKYGDTVEEVLAYAEELNERLASLENSEAHEAELVQALSKTEADLEASSGRLSDLRSNGSTRFADVVMA